MGFWVGHHGHRRQLSWLWDVVPAPPHPDPAAAILLPATEAGWQRNGLWRQMIGKGLQPHFLPSCSKPRSRLPWEHYHPCFQWSFDECSIVAGYKKLEAHPNKTSVSCGSTLKYISSEVSLYERNNLQWYWIPRHMYSLLAPAAVLVQAPSFSPALLVACLLSGPHILPSPSHCSPYSCATQTLSMALKRKLACKRPRNLLPAYRLAWYQFPLHLLLFRPQAFLPFPGGPVHSLTQGPCTPFSLECPLPSPHYSPPPLSREPPIDPLNFSFSVTSEEKFCQTPTPSLG